MIIDDSDLVLSVMTEMLDVAGYDVAPLSSPTEFEAAEVILQTQPAVVLVDVEMPGSRGDRLISVMRDYGFLSSAAVVLFSDKSELELALLVRTCGADGFIRKTADPEQLLEQVKAFIGKSEHTS